MIDKQIMVDGYDVSGCEHVCITKTFFREKTYIQCSAFFLENEDSYCDCADNPNCNYKNWKRKEQEYEVLKKLAETHLAETINMQREIDQLKEELVISIQENEEGREINAELKDQNSCFKLLHESDKNLLKRKEQEYNELKKTIDEAKNSKLDLKSFLVGEAIQNEYEQQLNQLKAENDKYKKMLEDEDVQLALTEIRSGERHLWYNKAQKLSQALTEIKDIAEHCMKQDICTTCDNNDKCHIEDEEIPTYDVCKLILQKCEVLDE